MSCGKLTINFGECGPCFNSRPYQLYDNDELIDLLDLLGHDEEVVNEILDEMNIRKKGGPEFIINDTVQLRIKTLLSKLKA